MKLCLLLLATAFSFEYLIKPEATLCLWEEINNRELAIVEISIKDKTDLKVLHMMISDPNMEVIYSKENMPHFIYSVIATVPGPYQFCVKN